MTFWVEGRALKKKGTVLEKSMEWLTDWLKVGRSMPFDWNGELWKKRTVSCKEMGCPLNRKSEWDDKWINE